ncbi:unnamed protein product [Cunninghamella echinulata]
MMYSYVFYLLFILKWLNTVYGQTSLFKITSPTENAPFVAGYTLPIIYIISNDTNISNYLSLSAHLIAMDPKLPFKQIAITDHADLSQGFSFERVNSNNEKYYEHELNYVLPKETPSGNYQVLFQNLKSSTNTTVPIIIRPYSNTSLSTNNNNNGSTTNKNNSDQLSSIFKDNASINNYSILFCIIAITLNLILNN